MSRHTIHEVAVNAKLIVRSFGNKKESLTGDQLFNLLSSSSDSQLVLMVIDMLEDKNYNAALLVTATLSERQNNQRRKAELEELNK